MHTAHDLKTLIESAFPCTLCQVEDTSHTHEGHSGHQPGGGTHFNVVVVSPAFAGKARIARHRMVYAALEAPLAARLHALALQTWSEEEYAAR
jgi:BolA protein